ncbi:MAG: response regulator [Gemmatimonadaceae bacterium]|nr:response regulator [Gemmatimonadaceae bacterium]
MHLFAAVTSLAIAGAPARAGGTIPALQATSIAAGEALAVARPWYTDWWWLPLVLAVALVVSGGVIAVVRRRNASLLDRARAAEASAQGVLVSEERFRRLFDRGADPQLLSDGVRIVAANPAATALLAEGDADRLVGLTTVQVTSDSGPSGTDDDMSYETEVQTVDGEAIPVALRRTRIPLDAGLLLHYQFRDLRDTRRLEAERRELEAQLLASQRLEALGTLAGGVAHDFNNLLTVIRANSEIAQFSMAQRDFPGVAESLHAVIQASDRARDIVKQILLFSRRSVPTHDHINLAALITDTQTLLRATIPSTVQLLVEVRNAEAWISGDATQMQQLLLNLCSNAEHAMRRTDGGMLRVKVDVISLDEAANAGRHPQLRPGRYVRLMVHDTGSGMNDDVRQRIFEPFFTTKPIGEGTGLGLAVLHGIVMSHHGSVHVESVEGEGTDFELLFALVPAPHEAPAGVALPSPAYTTPVPSAAAAALAGDAPLILLVDDEPGILRAAERGIMSAGMRVITAGSGGAALQLLGDHHDVALMITDQTMPEMTGLTLAERAKTLRPSMPIILSTGYTGRVTPDRLREAHIETVLDKPYTLTQLTDAIRGTLQSSRRRRTAQRA